MDSFRPPAGLRSPHTQSLLNSSALRRGLVRRWAQALQAAEHTWILDGSDGVRLMGRWTPREGRSKGLAVLLHGWEGSSESNYMLATGARLYAEGYDVFRLNFRDHGETHHLNPGIFHSCRLDEVIHALGDLQDRTGHHDWKLAGFSLGGNFALRIALKGPSRGLAVGRAYAVCPVLDPANVLEAMEAGSRFYENYYIRKWARSLRIKQACYPDRYDYEEWFRLPGLRARTEYFATRYYDFDSLEDYFEGYSIAGDRLAALAVPATILAAADDPVVPVSDAQALPELPLLDVQVTRYGGHCGYLRSWSLQSWAEDRIIENFNDGALLSAAANSGQTR